MRVILIILSVVIFQSCKPTVKEVNKKTGENKIAALTFDDGPDPINTVKILDVLKEYNVKATFFLQGNHVEKYPEITKRIFEEGHLIANHSYSHPHLMEFSSLDSVLYQLTKTDSLIKNITGKSHKYFRPPFGELSPEQKAFLEGKGFEIVMWDVSTKDWDINNVSADDIINTIDAKVFDGADILMHSTGANTAEAMPRIIELLKSKAYSLVCYDQLK